MDVMMLVELDSNGHAPKLNESALKTLAGTETVLRPPKGQPKLGKMCSACEQVSVWLDEDQEKKLLPHQAVMSLCQ